MENLQAVVQGIILDAVNQKFAEIPNKELALSCQAYAEQIAPEVVRQLFDGKADVDALRDITTRHAKNESRCKSTENKMTNKSHKTKCNKSNFN